MQVTYMFHPARASRKSEILCPGSQGASGSLKESQGVSRSPKAPPGLSRVLPGVWHRANATSPCPSLPCAQQLLLSRSLKSLFPGMLPSTSRCVLILSLTTSDRCVPRGERQPPCLRSVAVMAGVESGFALVCRL